MKGQSPNESLHITHFTEEDGYSQTKITRILQDSVGYIWLASWDGLLRYDGYRFKTYKARPGDHCPLPTNRIDNIEHADEGGLYCRVNGRFYHFKDDMFFTLSDSIQTKIEQAGFHPHSDMKKMVDSLSYFKDANPFILFVDNQDGLWINSNKGLSRIERRKEKYKTYTYDDGNKGKDKNTVRALYEDTDGRRWMADKSGFVRILPNKEDEKILYLTNSGKLTTESTSFGYNVYTFLQDKKGNMWIGCKPGGLFKMTPHGNEFVAQHFQHDTTDIYSLSHDEIYSLAEDSKGRIWVGTYESGVNLLTEDDKGSIRFIHSRNEMKNYPVEAFSARSLYPLSDSLLLIGTSAGLCVCRTTSLPDVKKLKFELYQRNPDNINSLSNNWILDIEKTNDDLVYIATYGGGINSINVRDLEQENSFFTCYTTEHGLPSDIILSLTKDYNGNIWCCSETALTQFNPQTKTSTNYMQRFFKEEASFTETTLLNLKDSTLIAGTTQGILAFHPKDMRRSNFVPKIVFDCSQDIWLKPEERNLTIRFAALDYNKNEQIHYAYRFEGISSGWIYTNENHINYSNIPAGTSTLLIRSTNGDGNWTENEQKITIHRTPYFNERPVAWMLYGILIVIMIGVVINILQYIKKLKKELTNVRLSTGETIEYLTAKLHETLSKGRDEEKRENLLQISMPESDDEQFRRKVNQFIKDNMSNSELSINNFAASVGVSRSLLYLQMKRLYDSTPNNYIQQLRLETAKQMLNNGNTNISEIAYRCGFSDPKYFSRLFKKTYEQTPTEYMQNVKVE